MFNWYKRISIFLLFLLSFPSLILAVDPHDQAEVLYDKAELAVEDFNRDRAIELLEKALKLNRGHYPSVHLLADIYKKRKRWAKAIKPLHNFIKQVHSREVLKSSPRPELQKKYISILEKIPKPTYAVLKTYEKMAAIYHSASKDESFTEQYRDRLVQLAIKYYGICIYYNHRVPKAQFSLALISREQKKYYSAIKHLLEAREELRKKDQNAPEIKEINYLLGDSLLRKGFIDQGAGFFRGLLNSKDTPAVYREFSNYYLDTLSTTFFTIGASLGVDYDSNVHDLSDEDYDNFQNDLQTSLVTKDAFKLRREFNTLLYLPLHRFWSTSFFVEYMDQVNQSESQPVVDTQDLTYGYDIKYSNLKESIIKLSYSFTDNSVRRDADGAFEPLSQTTVYTPQYVYLAENGSWTFKIPITFTETETASTTDTGFGISFTPFPTNPLFNTTYGIIYESIEATDAELENSSRTTFGIINKSNLDDASELFVNINYEVNSSPDPDESYSELRFGPAFNYKVQGLKGLSLYSSIERESTMYNDASQNINKWEVSSGLSYAF